MNRLDGKVALVTGGTRGIGYATATAMASAGAKVFITGRSEEKGRTAEAEISKICGDVKFVAHDAGSAGDWPRLIQSVKETYGGLHILVNNAGVYLSKSFIECTLEDYDRLFNLNLRAVFIGMQAAVPLIKDTVKDLSPGSIINVSSDCSFKPLSHQAIYNATKGGLDLLTRGLAIEFGELGYNIRVNSVNPGIVYTDMADTWFDVWIEEGAFKNREEIENTFKPNYPLGRFADPEDVAKLIVFLASDDSKYITGVNYRVDGGHAA